MTLSHAPVSLPPVGLLLSVDPLVEVHTVHVKIDQDVEMAVEGVKLLDKFEPELPGAVLLSNHAQSREALLAVELEITLAVPLTLVAQLVAQLDAVGGHVACRHIQAAMLVMIPSDRPVVPGPEVIGNAPYHMTQLVESVDMLGGQIAAVAAVFVVGTEGSYPLPRKIKLSVM